MKRLVPLAMVLILLSGWLAAASAQEKLSAEAIIKKSQKAFYYAGGDMRAKVVMDLITESGQRRTRTLTMLRKDDPKSEDQKYFLYFHEPGDVRRTAFLVWKHPGRDADRWIFVPAVNMVRRVAARDSRSSFVGSDFTYEDVSGRDPSLDTHTLLREEELNGSECYLVQSVPKAPMDYTKKLSWIDKRSFLPVKEEYYDAQNELCRVFTGDEVKEFAPRGGGKEVYPVVTRRTMKNLKSGHRTEVVFTEVALSVGLNEAVFTERSLQNPPAKWVQ